MKILFIDTVHPILNERLETAGYTCIDASQLSKKDCIKEAKNSTGIVVRSRFRMDESFLSGCDELKFIARSGAGMENIDVDYCESQGIDLYNSPEGNRNAVGEHALGMLLSLLNRLHLADREVRSGKWDREGNRGYELDGKTVGIIGFGNNGSAFAKKLRGFDVKVLAYDKYKNGFGTQWIEESDMDIIFKKADILSFHIPQNEETVGIFDQALLSQFSKPIILINLARGKIVDTRTLVEGLKNGKISGACLDVLEYEKSSFESFFEQELPEPFEYLLNSDQVILSPHVGGWTHESYFKLSNVLADKILS